jgi:DNA-binding PadR family transcriptional regulator
VSIYRKQTRISPEYVLLGFLYQHPGHGYELHRRLLDEFGYIWHVSQSQTYNILKRLDAQGYIQATAIPQEKLPTRQNLLLTERGLERFNNWLNTPTQCSVHAIRVEFITRLYFIQQYQPHQMQEAIRVQIEEVKKGLHRLKDTQASLPEDQVFNHLALEMRLRLLSSIISWLEECREKFASDEFNKDEFS